MTQQLYRFNNAGLAAFRFGIWTLVAVSMMFLVPDAGMRILVASSAWPESLAKIPKLIFLSTVPCAIVVEAVYFYGAGRSIASIRFAIPAIISLVTVVVWGYGEPHLYMNALFPNGFAAYETVLLILVGTFLTVALFVMWFLAGRRVQSAQRLS